MATAPTLISAVASVWNTGTTTAKTVSLACNAGDIICLGAEAEDAGRTFNNAPTNDGTALTWTNRGNAGTGAAAAARCAKWTATVDTTRTIVVSLAPSDASTTLWWGIIGKVWRGSDGVGATASHSNNSNSTTVSQAITTLQANSAIDMGIVDFGALDRSNTANYNTTAGTVAEDAYFNNTSHYTVNEAHYLDVGTAGAKTVGRTESYNWTLVAVEIKGSAAGVAAAPRRRQQQIVPQVRAAAW